MEIGFTLTNNGRYSLVLPAQIPGATAVQDATGVVFTKGTMPLPTRDPQGHQTMNNSAWTNNFQNSSYGPTGGGGTIPTSGDWDSVTALTGSVAKYSMTGAPSPAGGTVAVPTDPFTFCMSSSAGWGWLGYSRVAYNQDGGYSLFRNKFYPGIAGSGGANLTQTYPYQLWTANAWTNLIPPQNGYDCVPPWKPFLIQPDPGTWDTPGSGWCGWCGYNPDAGLDNLPYQMLAPDMQPMMGRPPNSGAPNQIYSNTGTDPVVEYTNTDSAGIVNPEDARPAPPRPQPLKAFVVVSIEDVEFIDVNLLASRITKALHETANIYNWNKTSEQEHAQHPSANENKMRPIPYATRYGHNPILNPNTQSAKLWDSIVPHFAGSTVRTLPANFWIGSNMEVSSPEKFTYRENWVEDWLWAGSGIGNNSNNLAYPDLANPGATLQPIAVGTPGVPYFWNNQIYGNMAVRDINRWKLMWQFTYGDIYNLYYNNLGTVGATMNLKTTVIMNTAIKSCCIAIPNGEAVAGEKGGQYLQNCNSGATGVSDCPAGYNLHEVSMIGSPQTDPTAVDFTGNVLYTNLEYTEFNLKWLSELFKGIEVYTGNVVGYEDQQETDGKNFYCSLDVGRCNDFMTNSCNTNSIVGGVVVADGGNSNTPIAQQACAVQEDSWDASARFSIITPYSNGYCSTGSGGTGGDTGWFGKYDTTFVNPYTDPTIAGFNYWATGMDHTQTLQADPTTESPIALDRFHLCPSYTITGLGADKHNVGKGRTIGRLQINNKYWSSWKQDLIENPYEMSQASGFKDPGPGSCDSRAETLSRLDDTLSKKYNVGAYPYEWHPENTGGIGVQKLICFRVAKNYNQFYGSDAGTWSPNVLEGDGRSNNPYKIKIEALDLGRLEYMNFFGISPAFIDNPAIVPMNSDSQKKILFAGEGGTPPQPSPNTIQQASFWNNMNYIFAGASNATCEFNSDAGRFEFSYFYTPTTLSQAYIEANDNDQTGVPQSGTQIATINEEGITSSGVVPLLNYKPGNGIKYFAGTFQQMNSNMGTGFIDNPAHTTGIMDTLTGIYIHKIWLVGADTNIPDVNELNNFYDKSSLYATSKKYADFTKDWIEADEDNYAGCLLDRMGFTLNDLMPRYGNTQNRFMEYSYASEQPRLCNQSKKPGIMNSKMSVSNSPFLDAYWDGITNTSPPAPAPDILGLPLYGQGLNGFISINQEATSEAITASNLPTLFDSPYYIINTTGLVEPKSWIGQNGILQTTMFYCLKNYASSDFFYGFASTFAITAEVEHPVGLISTEIRNPNSGNLVPLGENSSVIYKIQRKLEIPPIMFSPDGEALEDEAPKPSPEIQLLQEIANQLRVMNGETVYDPTPPADADIKTAQGDTTGPNPNEPLVGQLIQKWGGVGGGLLGRDLTLGEQYTGPADQVIRVNTRRVPTLTQEEGANMFSYIEKDNDDDGGPYDDAETDITSVYSVGGRSEGALTVGSGVSTQAPSWFAQSLQTGTVGMTEIEKFEEDMEELDEAQRRADEALDEGETGYIETFRKMRLINLSRNNPFEPGIQEALGFAGDPRREEQLLDQQGKMRLREELYKHAIRVRLATTLFSEGQGGDLANPDVDVVEKNILSLVKQDAPKINDIVNLISAPPTATIYNDLYELLTETFPEYPLFFSASTATPLRASQAGQALESFAPSIGISDRGLTELAQAIISQGIPTGDDPDNIDITFPVNPRGRGDSARVIQRREQYQAYTKAIQGVITDEAESDQVRVIERPVGWTGRFEENPDILWATLPPQIPYGQKSQTVASGEEGFEESQEYMGEKLGIEKEKLEKMKQAKTTFKRKKGETEEEAKQRRKERQRALGKAEREAKTAERKLDAPYRKPNPERVKAQDTEGGKEAVARKEALARGEMPRAVNIGKAEPVDPVRPPPIREGGAESKE